jgi:hypothetical protein
MKTLKQLAQEALNVQDACNLRGVLRSFHEASVTLGRLPECTGTEWVNTHPIMMLYADKVASLTGMQGDDGSSWGVAYDDCKALSLLSE